LLRELIDAVGDDTAIVVTTDHGGFERSHGEPIPANLETFVVVRSGRVSAGSMWWAASILDIAPTVADLAGVAPSSDWTGSSLLGSERPIAEHLLGLIGSMEQHSYGERVDMLRHSLQTAACARAAGGTDELVLAGLLHDIGHLLGEAGAWGLPDHAEVAARALQQWLPSAVVEPIRGHVAAKRFLVATDARYHDQLSEASRESLREQGGAFSPAECERFAAQPHADAAVTLRRHDDGGKVDGLEVPPLESYRSLLESTLRPA
jgi:predicted HD phosphohydrolase